MVTRVIVFLSLAGALALADTAAAQTRRQPYDVPNLLPRGNPQAMRTDEPWRPKVENPYAIKDEEPYPYSTPQSRQRAERAVRNYDPAAALGYLPPPAPPAAPRSSRPSGLSGPCNALFETCR